MAAAPQETAIEQAIISIFEDTRRVLDESQQRLPNKGSSLRPLRGAIGELSAANLARLSLGELPHSHTIGESNDITTFLTEKSAWIEEARNLRPNTVAEIARPLYIVSQNAALEELAEGRTFTLSRKDDASRDAIHANSKEGRPLVPIEGPIAVTLAEPSVEFGAFRFVPVEESADLVTESSYFARFLDNHGVVQLDLAETS